MLIKGPYLQTMYMQHFIMSDQLLKIARYVALCIYHLLDLKTQHVSAAVLAIFWARNAMPRPSIVAQTWQVDSFPTQLLEK